MIRFDWLLDSSPAGETSSLPLYQCVCIDCDEVWVLSALFRIEEEACPSCGGRHFCFAEVREPRGMYVL
jgi:rRNA maturation endonuclease Nob1